MKKKVFALFLGLFVLLTVGCNFNGNSNETTLSFEKGWYVYAGYNVRYYLYYNSETEITKGGTYKEQFSSSMLKKVNEEYTFEKVKDRLYYLGQRLYSETFDDRPEWY